MRAGESYACTPPAPLTATSAAFQLDGGKYWFVAQGGGFNSGTVALQRLGPNGVGYVTVGAAASLMADGGAVLDLPPGQYTVNLSTTGMVIYAEVVRINEE